MLPGIGFASLPMYDWPELGSDWDQYWQLVRGELRREGIASAEHLVRTEDPFANWLKPDLVLGQTCGWPYIRHLKGKVHVFGRFDFGLEAEFPGHYFSRIIAHPSMEADVSRLLHRAEIRIAVNDFDSQSGFRALGEYLNPDQTVDRSRIVITGSHRQSVRSVASGVAQLAAVDAQTWRYAEIHEPMAEQVQVIATSSPVPGLPLITANRNAAMAQKLLHCCKRAVRNLEKPVRERLCLRDAIAANGQDYRQLLDDPFSRMRQAVTARPSSA